MDERVLLRSSTGTWLTQVTDCLAGKRCSGLFSMLACCITGWSEFGAKRVRALSLPAGDLLPSAIPVQVGPPTTGFRGLPTATSAHVLLGFCIGCLGEVQDTPRESRHNHVTLSRFEINPTQAHIRDVATSLSEHAADKPTAVMTGGIVYVFLLVGRSHKVVYAVSVESGDFVTRPRTFVIYVRNVSLAVVYGLVQLPSFSEATAF